MRVFEDYGAYASRCLAAGLRPVVVDEAASTMAEASSCSCPCAVLAFRQAAGRGRRGRVWLSPEGGVWLTVRARCGWWSPVGLSVALGAAVAVLLRRLTGVPVMVKWPNDLVVDGFKVGGVLVEEAGGWVLVGIGVDYANDPPVEGASSIRLFTPCLPDAYLVAGALAEAAARIVRIPGEASGLLPLPRRLDYLAGRRVVVEAEDGVIAGRVEGVDEEGRLVLRLDDGERRALYCCSVAWAEGLKYKG